MLENSAEWGLSCDHSPRRPSRAMLDGVTVLTRTSGTLEAVGRVFRSCTLRWARHSLHPWCRQAGCCAVVCVPEYRSPPPVRLLSGGWRLRARQASVIVAGVPPVHVIQHPHKTSPKAQASDAPTMPPPMMATSTAFCSSALKKGSACRREARSPAIARSAQPRTGQESLWLSQLKYPASYLCSQRPKICPSHKH